MKKVLIVRSGEGDWEALYIDGVKVYENHSVPLDVVMKQLGIKIKYYDHPEMDDPDHANPLHMFPKVWTAS